MRVLDMQILFRAIRSCPWARMLNLVVLANLAIVAATVHAQRPGASFGSYYGSDAGNGVYEPRSTQSYSFASSRNDTPYQSHFGAARARHLGGGL